MCGKKFTNTTPVFNFFLCYRTPGVTLSQRQWDTIFENFGAERYLFVGDLNSDSVTWNCQRNDLNGDRLEECIDEFDTYLHNYNTYTYVEPHRGYKYNLDLALPSSSLANHISFKVEADTWGSVHFSVSVEINVKRAPYVKRTFKLETKRTDWFKFQKVLCESHGRFFTNEFVSKSSVDKMEFFTKIVTDALVASTPIRRPGRVHKKPRNLAPW